MSASLITLLNLKTLGKFMLPQAVKLPELPNEIINIVECLVAKLCFRRWQDYASSHIQLNNFTNNYRKLNMDSLAEEFKIYCGKYAPPGDRQVYPSESVHQIMLNQTGSNIVERRLDWGKWHTSSSYPGSFTFVRAERSQEWFWTNRVGMVMVELTPTLLEKVAAEGLSITSEIELIDRFVVSDPLLRQIVLAIYQKSKEPHALNRLYLESLQNTLMLHLLRHHCNLKVIEPNLSSGLSKLQLKEIMDYIDTNLSKGLGLAELAKVIQVSPPHFSRLFKQSMGISPHQYVLRCRIEKAKILLAEKKLPVKQIAQALGFYDQSHFSRAFRQSVGVTPKRYQQRL